MSTTDTGAEGVAAATDFTGAGNEGFDANLADFLSSDFGMGTFADDDATKAGEETQAAPAGNDTINGAAGNDTVSAGAGTDTTVGQDSAAGAASGDALAGGEAGNKVVEVDPAMLAAMVGLANPASTGGGPAPEATTEAKAEEKDEGFAPFVNNFRLPPQLVAGIFESEDTESREKALVTLLAAFGNTVTRTITEHFQKQIIPSSFQGYEARQQEVYAGRLIHDDFYSNAPDLVPYKAAVQKAFEVVNAKTPGGGYTPETRAQVAALARAGLAAAGIKVETKAAPAAAVKATPKVTPAHTGGAFEAGGGRPALSGGDSNSPEALLNEMSGFA